MSGFPLQCVLCEGECCIYCAPDEVSLCAPCLQANQQAEHEKVCEEKDCTDDKFRRRAFCRAHLKECLQKGCSKLLPLSWVKRVCHDHENHCLRCGNECRFYALVCAKNCGVRYCDGCTNKEDRYMTTNSEKLGFLCDAELLLCPKCGFKAVGEECIYADCVQMCCARCDRVMGTYEPVLCCEVHRDGCMTCFRVTVKGQPCPVCADEK